MSDSNKRKAQVREASRTFRQRRKEERRRLLAKIDQLQRSLDRWKKRARKAEDKLRGDD